MSEKIYILTRYKNNFVLKILKVAPYSFRSVSRKFCPRCTRGGFFKIAS
jgi:hypothetical protein